MSLKKLMEHRLAPWHEIVAKEEAEKIFKQLGVRAQRLPGILHDDPIAKELKAEKGDLIRIVRQSPTAGESIYYRVVL